MPLTVASVWLLQSGSGTTLRSYPEGGKCSSVPWAESLGQLLPRCTIGARCGRRCLLKKAPRLSHFFDRCCDAATRSTPAGSRNRQRICSKTAAKAFPCTAAAAAADAETVKQGRCDTHRRLRMGGVDRHRCFTASVAAAAARAAGYGGRGQTQQWLRLRNVSFEDCHFTASATGDFFFEDDYFTASATGYPSFEAGPSAASAAFVANMGRVAPADGC